MEPRYAGVWVQAWARALALPSLLLALAGCTGGPIDGPVAWWHGLEGGPIAQARPAPPGVELPYPNLSTVPARPPAADPKMQAEIAAALARDRANARFEAAESPLVAAPAKVARSGLFAGAAPASAADPNAAGAALAASEPAPASAPRTVATPAAVIELKPALSGNEAVPAWVTQRAALTMADAPPAPPRLAGVVIPVTVPHLPAVAPVAAAGPAAALSIGQKAPVAVAFAAGSAVLPAEAQAGLQALAARRGGRRIEVIGFGEAAGDNPALQVAALSLGMARARAIATGLEGAGVPMTAVDVQADASGRGGAARLLE